MAGRGRPPKARGIAAIRELTSEDIARLDNGERGKVPVVQRFRDSHHAVARLFAQGHRHQAVAAITGYSLARLYTLTATPSFQELIASYRPLVLEDYAENADHFTRLATSNMLKAERMVADRLDKYDEDGELPTLRELATITSDRADRFGYGKKNLQVNLHGDFATMFERAVQRSAKVIDGEARQSTSPLSQPRSDIVQASPSPLRRRA